MNKSYATEVIADNSGKWVGNGIRFPFTAEGKDAADQYVYDLAMRWTSVREWRVVESTDEPNRIVERVAK